MDRTAEAKRGDDTGGLPPLKISRVFHARREAVFAAWSTAERVKQWFSPETYTVPQAQVEMRPGGPFEICMRAPDGATHWARGVFVEVTAPSRLVIDMRVESSGGQALFRVVTEATFADALGGTRMDVTQTYTLLEAAGADPALGAAMTKGAPEGWRTTLDKLEAMLTAPPSETEAPARSVVHAIFHLERAYDAPLLRVWQALTTEGAKSKWFSGTPGQWDLLERQMDVRPGGRERLKGRWASGLVTTFDATYLDVVPQARLVYVYEMWMDDRKISASLATMQLQAKGGQTVLSVTEQGAFLDGYDDAGSREQGTGFLLDAIGVSLAA